MELSHGLKSSFSADIIYMLLRCLLLLLLLLLLLSLLLFYHNPISTSILKLIFEKNGIYKTQVAFEQLTINEAQRSQKHDSCQPVSSRFHSPSWARINCSVLQLPLLSRFLFFFNIFHFINTTLSPPQAFKYLHHEPSISHHDKTYISEVRLYGLRSTFHSAILKTQATRAQMEQMARGDWTGKTR